MPIENIHPIKIATPFAVGEVYCYLINEEKKVLVDCGQKAENSYELVKKQLKSQGLVIADLDEIWLSHGHPDHFGQAARLADESGADVYGHVKERSNFANYENRELFDEFFSKHMVPKDHRSFMIEQLDWLQQYQQAITPSWIEDGEELTSGELTFSVKHSPGHAPGHLTFFSKEGIIFGGDNLLEHISTNALINFDPDTGERNSSLLQYRETLQWIRTLEGVVHPGHGKFIRNISKVADHHLSEHRKRYQKIQSILKEQPYSLYELSLRLFPDAVKKGGIFLVLSEVIGYLDWGVEEGVIRQEGEMFFSEQDSIKN
ncbi:MBL fold metallo-hydrolase [Balneolaceae bacterium YR4-1]|uniref:MBL fold metallo-hydrolase n=1 Tax=Halalkalibaculum roseum TaxID=2709311 RepID=A0A6M1T4T2_9BACT|nr:MBL fold metallo-hydrolase [Halalkalibaculum roseum]NGP75363.1 MBL fold metallo-hydrolase [Halalkalibaculum roseum]